MWHSTIIFPPRVVAFIAGGGDFDSSERIFSLKKYQFFAFSLSTHSQDYCPAAAKTWRGAPPKIKNGDRTPVVNPLVFAIKYTVHLWYHYTNGACLGHLVHRHE